jgi:hypothetical protein
MFPVFQPSKAAEIHTSCYRIMWQEQAWAHYEEGWCFDLFHIFGFTHIYLVFSPCSPRHKFMAWLSQARVGSSLEPWKPWVWTKIPISQSCEVPACLHCAYGPGAWRKADLKKEDMSQPRKLFCQFVLSCVILSSCHSLSSLLDD